MFKIDRNENRIGRLKSKSFTELGFRERAHLQEWIANQPDTLGEELLIIQKEFAGFSDTNERLDLLAIDKQGSLVIIENKLDDTGRDVTWQALKYASYCARLTKDQIRDIFQDYLSKQMSTATAEDELCAFLDAEDYAEINLNKGVTQRIILVAAQFRKEVTSTVLWLSSFKLRIQCFKVTPFADGEDLFLNVDQIIPTKEAEDFMIVLAAKAQGEVEGAEAEKTRHALRKEFWSKFLPTMNAKSDLFQNVSPRKENWISAPSRTRGVTFNCLVRGDCCRVEVYINTGDDAQNLALFDALYRSKLDIDHQFGAPLDWERMDGKKACRIRAEMPGDVYDRAQWPDMTERMIAAMLRMVEVFRPRLAGIGAELPRSPT